MKELINRSIERIQVDTIDNSVIRFETGDGPLTYFAEGDCCSESWFADISNVYALLGGTVLEVEEVIIDDYNTDDGRCRQEFDSVYSYRITTDKGVSLITFRNSSNGYYGGSIELLPENPHSHIQKLIDKLEDIDANAAYRWSSPPKGRYDV